MPPAPPLDLAYCAAPRVAPQPAATPGLRARVEVVVPLYVGGEGTGRLAARCCCAGASGRWGLMFYRLRLHRRPGHHGRLASCSPA